MIGVQKMGRYDGEYASDKKNTLYEIVVDFLKEIPIQYLLQVITDAVDEYNQNCIKEWDYELIGVMAWTGGFLDGGSI